MKTIKFYKTKGFDFQETFWEEYAYPDGTTQLQWYYVTHKVTGHTAIIDGDKVYFAYNLHDLPPYPSMNTDNTFEGAGTDAESDDRKVYLRNGSDRWKPIYDENDNEIGIEEWYQKHALDFFNKGGLTYIRFDKDFAGGGFHTAANKILKERKRYDRNNLHYKPTPEGLIGLNWL